MSTKATEPVSAANERHQVIAEFIVVLDDADLNEGCCIDHAGAKEFERGPWCRQKADSTAGIGPGVPPRVAWH